MQPGHRLRYLAMWPCTITCDFLLFCDTLLVYAPLRSVPNVCHWHTAPSRQVFAPPSCKRPSTRIFLQIFAVCLRYAAVKIS